VGEAKNQKGVTLTTVRFGARLRQAHLLNQLIPTVLHSRPPAPVRRTGACAPLRPRRQYKPDDVRRWLTTLAEELWTTGTRDQDWLWWYLARHTFPTTRTALTVRLVVGLVVGRGGGLMFGLTAAPAHADLRLRGRVPELLRSLAVALVGGLVIGLVVGLGEFGSSANIAQRASSPAESQRGDRRLAVLIASTSGLVGGLVGGLGLHSSSRRGG
jgi:hypothetical protein